MNNTFEIQLKDYSDDSTRVEGFNNHRDALAACRLLTTAAEIAGWSRHCSVKGPIIHMSMYHDLYNEGCILLNSNATRELINAQADEDTVESV
jgi:hypothetical protein